MHAESLHVLSSSLHALQTLSDHDQLVNENHCAWVVRFSTAIPKDKPNQLMNALKLKTAQQESSSSCLALNLHTTHQALVAEKSNVDKHKLKR